MPSTESRLAARVRFSEQRVLRAQDLSAEQAYLIAPRRLHNLTHHGWGIASGLCVATDAPLGPRIEPGLAIDRFGRELIVAEPIDLSGAQAGCIYDAWLVYLRRPAGPDGGRFGEDVFIRLVTVDADTPPVMPAIPVAATKFTFSLPDDPAAESPVFLGRIDLSKSPADVDGTGRTYAALFGEEIVHPHGYSRVQVGAEGAADRRRFVVSFPDELAAWRDRLAVNLAGDTSIYGHLFANATSGTDDDSHPPSCLSLSPAEQGVKQPNFGGMTFLPLAQPPEIAKPWQLFQVAIPDEANPAASPAHELRIEIAHPGTQDNPANYRLAVWGWPAPPDNAKDPATFQYLLTVRADKTVEVNGDLIIGGLFLKGPIDADSNDPRFREILAAQWASGLAQGVGALAPGGLGVTLSNTADPGSGAGLLKYTLTVKNNATVPVDSIQIAQNIVYNGVATGPRSPDLFRLEVGQSQPFPQEFRYTFVAGQTSISVGVLATGVSAAGKFVFDRPGTKTYTISS
jgi:hypothetical protein